MTKKEAKQFRQRQAMITEVIEQGQFDDRDHFKAWMKSAFALKQPLAEISTEYSLNEKQKKLLFVWLKYFTGRGPKPRTHRAKQRITNGQLTRIDELAVLLGMNPSALADFVQRQTGKRKLVPSLFKGEATKVITGLERIWNEQPYKEMQ
jgi:AraC-like DNA-binding protein